MCGPLSSFDIIDLLWSSHHIRGMLAFAIVMELGRGNGVNRRLGYGSLLACYVLLVCTGEVIVVSSTSNNPCDCDIPSIALSPLPIGQRTLIVA